MSGKNCWFYFLNTEIFNISMRCIEMKKINFAVVLPHISHVHHLYWWHHNSKSFSSDTKNEAIRPHSIFHMLIPCYMENKNEKCIAYAFSRNLTSIPITSEQTKSLGKTFSISSALCGCICICVLLDLLLHDRCKQMQELKQKIALR